MDKCRVISITNQKGCGCPVDTSAKQKHRPKRQRRLGVGKTTTAVNLGVGLAQVGNNVLLIDADPQGSLTLSLGIEKPDNLEVTLANVMENIVNDDEIPSGFAILKIKEGVDLVPANILLSGVEVGLVAQFDRERILKRYVDIVRDNYDFIIIDCMPSLGMMTFNALCAADSVIIPTQPEFLSAKGIEQLLKTIVKVRNHINPNLTIDGILLTMTDMRTRFGKGVVDLIRSNYGSFPGVFETTIPRSIRAAETSAEGVSIFAHDKSGKVAEAYKNLTKEVIADGEERQCIKNKNGFDR